MSHHYKLLSTCHDITTLPEGAVVNVNNLLRYIVGDLHGTCVPNDDSNWVEKFTDDGVLKELYIDHYRESSRKKTLIVLTDEPLTEIDEEKLWLTKTGENVLNHIAAPVIDNPVSTELHHLVFDFDHQYTRQYAINEQTGEPVSSYELAHMEMHPELYADMDELYQDELEEDDKSFTSGDFDDDIPG